MRTLKKSSRRKRRNWPGFITAIVLTAAALLLLLGRLDSVLTPIALDMAQKRIVSNINRLIDDSYSSIIAEQHIDSADLFVSKADGASGKVSSMYVDTVLVNEISNKLAVRVSNALDAMSRQTVSVPVGSLSGYEIFSGAGPSYHIQLLPVGDALVDPRSERDAVGINQVNILVWLDVKCEARIVAPFQKDREIAVTRSLPLINTYFSQEVPNTYWNGGAAVISPGLNK